MRSFVLGAGLTTIGRSTECTISVTDDDELSRKHAVVERTAGHSWQIRDCGSANGVFVNGRQVESSTLAGGEVIRLGTTFFRFIAGGIALRGGEHQVILDGMVSGPALDSLRNLLDRAADQELTVLITGETGTGKELAARHLHRASAQHRGPFVAVNCAAIPAEMVESELFGHLKGAFTGATSDKLGLIREAAGGTLFLDEIGELPLASQAKLLRVLQDREVRPVGAGATVSVDLRVVCATNRDLAAAAQRGEFRPDLYARIAQLIVHLPALRDRIEDVPLLLQHFIAKHAGHRCLAQVETLELLCCHPWPFNIRELEHAVRRALLIAGESTELEPAHFSLGVPAAGRPAEAEVDDDSPVSPGSDDPRVARLREVLVRHGGDVDQAAAELGLSRSQLYRRAKKFGIQVAHYRG